MTAKSLFAGLALALGLLATSVAADSDDVARIVKPSPHDVAGAIDRLAAVVEAAGATVFARIDHGAGAAAAGLEMPPAQVLVFGNPKMGTQLMKARPEMALDLPLRVAAVEGPDGEVTLVYPNMRFVAAQHGLDPDRVSRAMTALDRLTDRALAAD